MKIPDHFALKVLGHSDGLSVAAEGVKLAGRRLIAKTASPLVQDTCIRIDCDDSLLLGYIAGCWNENSATFVAIELEQALCGISNFAQSQTRFIGSINLPLAGALQRHSA